MTLLVVTIEKESVEEVGLLVDEILSELRVDVLGELCAESERSEEEEALLQPLILRDIKADNENDVELDTDPLCVAKLLSLPPLLTEKVTLGEALFESLDSEVKESVAESESDDNGERVRIPDAVSLIEDDSVTSAERDIVENGVNDTLLLIETEAVEELVVNELAESLDEIVSERVVNELADSLGETVFERVVNEVAESLGETVIERVVSELLDADRD